MYNAPIPHTLRQRCSEPVVVPPLRGLLIAATESPFSDDVAAGVRAGDPEALTAVYEVLVQPLTSYLRSQVRNSDTAFDLAQETFIELVRACRGLTGGPREIRAWLYRAAQRNVIDHFRYKGRRPEDLTAETPDTVEPARGPDEMVLAGEEADRIRAALARLSPEQAQVLALRFLAGLSAPEVAAVMDRTEGSVRALQHRGTAAMARILGSQTVLKAVPATPDSYVRLRSVEVR